MIILLLKMNGTLSGPLSAIFAQFRVITTFLIYFGSQAPWRVTNVVCSPRSYPRSQDRSVFLRSPGSTGQRQVVSSAEPGHEEAL